MRWDDLLLHDEPVAAATGAPVPLLPRGAVTRTFDTPGFRGITFHEVTSRSALNKVPDASRMPFRWTINPYRGCSHACVYCVSGETLILMDDGRARPIAEIGPGDRVYGTQRDVGGTLTYVVTDVLDHWQTVRPAFRVTLMDGTVLVASGDHKFLTDDDWKHVAPGSCESSRQRPSLTVNDTMMGLGHRHDGPNRSLKGFKVESNAALTVVSVEEMGVEIPMYDLSTGTGDFIANGVISHNCFARKTHEYLDLDSGHDFDSQIVVKTNVGEVLRRELARPSWKREHVAMGTNVDCYQRAEGRYRLMRDIIPALTDVANPFSILTKGVLILRDLDLLTAAASVTDVSAAVSVGFVDETLWRSVEPGTPSPVRRLDACSKLNGAGIRCGVLMAPILPFLSDSDEQLEAAVAAVAASGAAYVSPIVLHLRPGAREWWQAWLRREHPHLLPRYAELYAGRAYAPTRYQREVSERVHELAARYGIGRPRSLRGNNAGRSPARPAHAAPAATPRSRPEQLSLL